MKIDYSIPESSKYYLCLDAQFRWGVRNIFISLSNQLALSLPERVFHMVIGLVELIPGLGLGVGLIDRVLQGRVQVLELDQNDPYARGMAHGVALKNEIHFIYNCVNRIIDAKMRSDEDKRNFQSAIDRIQQGMPLHLITEMQGIAQGAEVGMDEVFRMHAFLDIYAGQFGCSTLATVQKENEEIKKVISTNHFQSEAGAGTCERFKKLQNTDYESTIDSHKNAMKDVSIDETILSVVFNCNQNEIEVANSWQQTAKTFYSYFSFFDMPQKQNNEPEVLLSANLDWPWPVLAPYIVLIKYNPIDVDVDGNSVHKEGFVNITFPGYIGVLRGMNEHGVALANCQSGSSKKTNGLPITFVFRTMIETAKSVESAKKVLKTLTPASSMNLTIAGKDGACVVEIDPNMQETGYSAEISPT